MLVTLFGITISVNPVQYLKAESPMLVTLFGITLFLQPKIKVLSLLFIKQSPSDLYVEFSSLTCMFSRLVQFLNALTPMLVIPLPSVILARLVQF